MKEEISDNLWNHYRKADQTRSIHALIQLRYERYNRFIRLFITIGSAVSAMLIFAALSAQYRLFAGLLAAFISIINAVRSEIRYDTLAKERGIALQLWGDWLKDAIKFGDVEMQKMSDDQAKVKHDQLMEAYKSIMASTPPISDKQFLRGKQKHLQKIAISKALDKNPHKSLKQIKRELKASGGSLN